MPAAFESWSQNLEDVVLWRALADLETGVYAEIGANHPSWLSMTKAFYDRGWRGLTVEPVREWAELHRRERPGDVLVEAAVSSSAPTPIVLHEIDDTGLSTTIDDVGQRHADTGWTVHDVEVPTRRLDDILAEADLGDIHFLSVDVEGAEADVLSTLDLHRFRPWILVVESTAPLQTRQTHHAWEPQLLAAGYRACLFDGLSRFYVAEEHAERLGPALSYPACVLDDYRGHLERNLRDDLERVTGELAAITEDAIRWRSTALVRWSEAIVSARSASSEELQQTVDHLHSEIHALHQTVSWRVTAPLRAVRAGRTVGGS